MYLKSAFIFISICLSLNTIYCLYEDQVGKFDWKQNYIGKIRSAQFYGLSNRIIVLTEENVLAVLNGKDGTIIWRQIFEKSNRGETKYMYVNTNTNIINNNNRQQDLDIDIDYVLTVSGSQTSLIRLWNPHTGTLISEWSISPNSLENIDDVFWFYHNSLLYYVTPVWQSHIEVAKFNAKTGVAAKSTATRINTPWITKTGCVLSDTIYVCLNGTNSIRGIDLVNENILNKMFDYDLPMNQIRLAQGDFTTVIIGNEIIDLLDSKYQKKLTTISHSVYNKKITNNKNVLIEVVPVNGDTIEIISTDLDTMKPTDDIHVIVNKYPKHLGKATIIDVKCKKSSTLGILMCNFLLSTENGAIVLLQHESIKWIREEALTKIVAIEMIDFPLSDLEGTIETELNSKDGDVLGASIRRIGNQIHQIRNFALSLIGLGAQLSASQTAGLVRDAFGLHKMIVAVTESGKIFGIDNLSGKFHWITYLDNISGFGDVKNIQLLVQRTSKHFPFSPLCTIIGTNKLTKNGVIYQFNPVTGQSINNNNNNNGVIDLSYKIKQFSLLHKPEDEFIKPILLLDEQNNLHVIPESSTKTADGQFIFVADKNTGIVSGYFVQYKQNILSAMQTWQLHLGGELNLHRITRIASKNPIENVHSQGRVLNDRSVLYKYINPNLVAIVTEGTDSTHKFILNIHLIDVVSGTIIFSISHRRAHGPIHIIHSENWIIYTYYNEKVRRTEIATLDLYEGKTQANSTVWSSLDAPPLPMVERQSFIIPSTVLTLRQTITEKGITNKNILIGLASGSVIEMPWILLDPSRPVLLQNQMREEGTIPYLPELPLPTENIINYNQSVEHMRDIYTTPSGLESTCLIVIYGLDIFVARVAPSKTFDLLIDDFDYILLSLVLIGLISASYIVKYLSSKKTVKQAWK